MKKIMIVGGKTGGHIFPGLSVADELVEKGYPVVWVGEKRGLEQVLVEQKSIPFIPIHAFSRQQAQGWRILLLPFLLLHALIDAFWVLYSEKPVLLVGMGGYVAAIVCWLATFLHIPVILCEQNAVAGRVNARLQRRVCQVYAGFDHAFTTSHRVSVVGNPLRPAIREAALKRASAKREDITSFKLLVLGGSQGAQKINETLVKMCQHWPTGQRIEIWHQVGLRHLSVMRTAYKGLGAEVHVEAFIEQPEQAYLWADCVVARAGAMTVSELSMMGLPSVLIPYPSAKDDHQTYNAHCLVDSGAAVLLPQSELTSESLQTILLQLCQNPERLHTMAIQARAVAKPDAHQRVAQGCIDWLQTVYAEHS